MNSDFPVGSWVKYKPGGWIGKVVESFKNGSTLSPTTKEVIVEPYPPARRVSIVAKYLKPIFRPGDKVFHSKSHQIGTVVSRQDDLWMGHVDTAEEKDKILVRFDGELQVTRCEPGDLQIP
jgi:hypothetical protein